MAASDKPRLACEITPDRVIAARAADTGAAVDAVSARTLAAGSVNPALAGTNLADPAAVRDAIADAIAAVGSRSRDVVAVLPDAAVRVALLDFEELPAKRRDADAVVRFRLKKSLPFDVDTAALSYDVRRSDGNLKVVAAVAPAIVVEEYEAAFREAGYSPGVVLPSMLAAISLADAQQPTLVVKVDPGTTSFAIVRSDGLLLYRTVENAHGVVYRTLEKTQGPPLDAGTLAEDIYPSLVFFQDNYGLKVECILLAGLISARDLGPALEAHTGARVGDLVSPARVGASGSLPPSLFAGVVGGLLG